MRLKALPRDVYHPDLPQKTRLYRFSVPVRLFISVAVPRHITLSQINLEELS